MRINLQNWVNELHNIHPKAPRGNNMATRVDLLTMADKLMRRHFRN